MSCLVHVRARCVIGIGLAKEASPDLTTEAEVEIPQLEEELSTVPEVERKAVEAEIEVDPVRNGDRSPSA